MITKMQDRKVYKHISGIKKTEVNVGRAGHKSSKINYQIYMRMTKLKDFGGINKHVTSGKNMVQMLET